MNPLVIVELVLRIVLTAMDGQTPEQKAKLWEFYVRDVERWRKILKLDETPLVASVRRKR